MNKKGLSKDKSTSKTNDADLRVSIAQLNLKSPIVCASGTFGFGDELKNMVDFSAIGAVTAKTITLDPKVGNPPPRIYETSCGIINSIGLENPGLGVFLKEKLPALSRLSTKIIVSLGGASQKEYEKLIQSLDKEKAVDAFELNLSCPNLKSKKLISQSQRATAKLIQSLRKQTKKTLIAKLTPEVNDIVKIAKAAEDSGADALALVNTYRGLSIDVQARKPHLGNVYGGYSGPAIKPISLYKVWRVAGSVEIPVIGGGGILDYKDALEFLLAGAAAISLGTVNLISPNAAKDILVGIKKHMKENQIKSLEDIRGGVNA